MRIYEIAKLLNVTSKEITAFLEEQGFSVKSHMSVITQEAVDLVDKKFKQKIPGENVNQDAVVGKEKVVVVEQPKPVKQTKQEPSVVAPVIVEKKVEESSVIIISPKTLGEASELLKKPVGELALVLLKQGIVSAKNMVLSAAVVESLAKHYEIPYRLASEPKKVETVAFTPLKQKNIGEHNRLPVVVVVGHVDHGKTTLLDFIRKTRVAQKEKGGITQHLGAYEATTDYGNIVFLDTPGHEAFSNIRGRGLKVADIAILVVAADDGVMPQTIEAIKKAKEAGVPVVVAINKVDNVPPARVEVVKNEVSRHGLLPEEWGGETIFMPISAKTGQGIDKLLEILVLQSQLMDLKTNLNQSAIGFVLESKIEKGLGFVATVICQAGTLRVGDFFVAGNALGKVNSLTSSFGKKINEVGPSVPVLVAGFLELAHAGDFFEVVSQDKFKKLKQSRTFGSTLNKSVNEDLASIKMIIKTDTSSSKEALINSIEKNFSSKISVIYAGIGNIVESDVVLAANTGAMIIGLHVKTESNAVQVAQKNIVHILLFDIIYKLLEHIEELIEKGKPITYVSKKIGEAIIRKVFNVKGIGVIAGAYLKEGRFAKVSKIVAWRGREKIGSGPIKSLERDRKAVKEVHAGYEFAFLVEGMDDWQIDDRAECFIEVAE